MPAVDLKKQLSPLYAPRAGVFVEVDVPELTYLMIDGRGDPNSSSSYVEAVEALYSVSYALKFASRRELGKDYVVMPLEGLWFSPDPSVFTTRAKDSWQWTMMILQPETAAELLEPALASVAAKKRFPALSLLRLEALSEGRSIQTLHVGSYDDEAPVLARLHDEVMPDRGLTFNGHHHEVYLGDPRRAAPEKLRTILRQPVRPAD